MCNLYDDISNDQYINNVKPVLSIVIDKIHKS